MAATKELLDLVSDPKFARLEGLAERPNLFKIIGRTHTETWHSMLLGWLLDPRGSHGLEEYALKRFLWAVSGPTLCGREAAVDCAARLAARSDLRNAHVLPNERDQVEFQAAGMKLDLFVRIQLPEEPERAVIVVEQKVKAGIQPQQCRSYADWLQRTYPTAIRLPVMLAPAHALGSAVCEKIKDERWCAIDYQTLHDAVLVPCLEHHAVSERAAALLAEYVDALRTPTNGRKLVVTEEERELAQYLYEKHRQAFEIIRGALLTVNGEEILPDKAGSTSLNLVVDGTTITGSSVKDFYLNALEYITSEGLPLEKVVPMRTSDKRYLVAKTPLHQGGNEFRGYAEHGGFYMCTDKNYQQAVADLARLFGKLGCNVASATPLRQ